MQPTGEGVSYNNYPAKNYLFKVNNRRRSGVFIVNFETYFTLSSSVSIVNFEQVIVCWLVGCLLYPGWQIGIQKLTWLTWYILYLLYSKVTKKAPERSQLTPLLCLSIQFWPNLIQNWEQKNFTYYKRDHQLLKSPSLKLQLSQQPVTKNLFYFKAIL